MLSFFSQTILSSREDLCFICDYNLQCLYKMLALGTSRSDSSFLKSQNQPQLSSIRGGIFMNKYIVYYFCKEAIHYFLIDISELLHFCFNFRDNKGDQFYKMLCSIKLSIF